MDKSVDKMNVCSSGCVFGERGQETEPTERESITLREFAVRSIAAATAAAAAALITDTRCTLSSPRSLARSS